MADKLPQKKVKKKIDTDKFIKLAKKLKVYFDEEKKYISSKEKENESLLSGRSL